MADPIGTWYLTANDSRLAARISASGAGFTATLDTGEAVDNVAWDETASVLEFRRIGAGWWQWYRATLVEGVMAGRFSHQATPARPALTAFAYHVTGWNRDQLDAQTEARVWELTINGSYHGRLRIDRPPEGSWVGQLKVYAGLNGEELEQDLTAVSWDGVHLAFTRGSQVYTGTAAGRSISGTFTAGGSFPWSGVRAEVLSHGLLPMPAAARSAWQDRARAQLRRLALAGDPEPLSTTAQVVRSGVAPIGVPAYPADRDDDPQRHPAAYTLTELTWTHTLPNPYGGAPITRTSHGYLAVPGGLQPGETRPAVLAVNGHGGSAYASVNGADATFWYGDGFARRGYVVLAVDMSHRNDSTIYSDVPGGDDPAHGNGPHPSIKAPGFDTDWEEDGERAWDAMRGLDHLLALPYVDPARVVVTGISMGGEVTTYVGALDQRPAVVVPAGYSPDMSVLLGHGNHPCWRWAWADVREYIDVSDLHALIAPRPLVVLTGRTDTTFSSLAPPFASDKQVMRRSAAAYVDAPGACLHFLHYDVHRYHVGDFAPGRQPPAGFQNGVQVARLTAPTAPGSTAWQTDGSTQTETLFDLLEGFLEGT